MRDAPWTRRGVCIPILVSPIRATSAIALLDLRHPADWVTQEGACLPPRTEATIDRPQESSRKRSALLCSQPMPAPHKASWCCRALSRRGSR